MSPILNFWELRHEILYLQTIKITSMRVLMSLLVLVSCAWLFTACPVSTTYPLAQKSAVKLDESFLGEWQTEMEDIEAKKISVKEGTEANTYQVTVTERGSMFMGDGDDFIGWLAELGGERFMVLQQMVDGHTTETYYVYHVVMDGGTLITNDITLQVGGTDAITSTAAYQAEVLASMKMDEFLVNEIKWGKVN